MLASNQNDRDADGLLRVTCPVCGFARLVLEEWELCPRCYTAEREARRLAAEQHGKQSGDDPSGQGGAVCRR